MSLAWVFLLMSSVALGTGCMKNVTTDSRYHVGFVPGETYEFTRDMWLCTDPDTDPPKHFVIVPSNYGRANRAASKESLAAGCRVTIHELWFETTLMLKDVYRVVVPYGLLVDAPNEGTRVDLREVSVYNWEADTDAGAAIFTPGDLLRLCSSDAAP